MARSDRYCPTPTSAPFVGEQCLKRHRVPGIRLFADHRYRVEIATTSDPGQLPGQLAQTLGVCWLESRLEGGVRWAVLPQSGRDQPAGNGGKCIASVDFELH